MHAKPNASLKARAIMWLAQREHSRSELRGKLLNHARAASARKAGDACREDAPGNTNDDAPTAAPPELEIQVDALLDWLEAHHYLSQARFIESRVHARAARYGNLRIGLELARHGVALAPDAAHSLQQSEFARAHAVWTRKFGTLPADAPTRARQSRFLAGRGFSAEVIHRVLKGAGVD